jgi:molecular chaperone GrpE
MAKKEESGLPAEHDMPPELNGNDSKDDIKLDVVVDHEAVASAEVVSLKAQLQKAQDEVVKTQDQTLRALAEAENLKRRYEKELQDTRKYAVSSLVKELINVAEVLYQSTEQITDEQKQAPAVLKIIEGIELTRKELMNVLLKHGVRRIAPACGDTFDHNYHQAISQIPDASYPKNTIIKVIQAGYALEDRLIKPALVIVSSGASQES